MLVKINKSRRQIKYDVHFIHHAAMVHSKFSIRGAMALAHLATLGSSPRTRETRLEPLTSEPLSVHPSARASHVGEGKHSHPLVG